ncbi:MAG: hypothetical protein IBJ12_11810, partial [Sphingomonadaceae bacterium]|nr:hypothetical protein [Sphingomonadaceae bacterium]
MLDKRSYWSVIDENRHLGQSCAALSEKLYAADAAIHVGSPVGNLAGSAGLLKGLWSPLIAALPDLERRTDILLCGEFTNKAGETGNWFASTGFLVGHFEEPLWSIKPTKRPLWIRYGWFDRAVGDRIVESYVIFDVARMLIDAGQWPLAPQLGQNQWPAPRTQDGVLLGPTDPAESEQSLKLVEAMIAGLMRYDGQSLASMRMIDFWHPQFHWYGPVGIVSAQGHRV